MRLPVWRGQLRADNTPEQAPEIPQRFGRLVMDRPGVDHLERRAGHCLELVEVRVVPVRVGGAGMNQFEPLSATIIP